MIPRARYRHRTDVKRSGGGVAPGRAVPGTVCSGWPVAGLACLAGLRPLHDGVPPGGRSRRLRGSADPDDEDVFRAGGTFAALRRTGR